MKPESLDRLAPLFPPPESPFEGFLRHRDRKRRRRKAQAMALSIVITAASVGLVLSLRNELRPTPVDRPPTGPHLGITRGDVRGFTVMNLQGQTLGRIPGLPRRAGDVAVSPDGRRLAFVLPFSYRTPDGPQSGIWTIGVDGTNLRRVGGRATASPTWYPDGSRITSFGAAQAHTVDADGTHPRAAAACGASLGSLIAYPKWSPDATEILCSAISGGGTSHGNVQVVVYPVSPDGQPGEFTALAGDAGVNAWDGAWSPDGTQIAFSRGDTGKDFDINAATPSYDIWIMNADGSGQHPLVQSDEGADVGPFWSPGGSMIAYTSIGETRSVWVVDIVSGSSRFVGPGTVFGWLDQTTLVVGGST